MPGNFETYKWKQKVEDINELPIARKKIYRNAIETLLNRFNGQLLVIDKLYPKQFFVDHEKRIIKDVLMGEDCFYFIDEKGGKHAGLALSEEGMQALFDDLAKCVTAEGLAPGLDYDLLRTAFDYVYDHPERFAGFGFKRDYDFICKQAIYEVESLYPGLRGRDWLSSKSREDLAQYFTRKEGKDEIIELADTGSKDVMGDAFSVFERKEIVSKEISGNITRLMIEGSARSMAAPQRLDGTVFRGCNAAYLTACLQSRPDWQPLFLSRDEVKELGLKIYPGDPNNDNPIKVSVLNREAGSGVIRDVVFNVADTDFGEKYPREFDAICRLLSHPIRSNFDEAVTEKALKDYRENATFFHNKALIRHNPHLAEMENEVASLLVENVLATTAGYEGQLIDPKGLKELPFPEATALSKDGARVPAYEIHRHAGRMLDAVLEEYPRAYPSLGVNCRELMAEMAKKNDETVSKDQSEGKTEKPLSPRH